MLLEPVFPDVEAWLAELERYRDVPFMENGREQPAAQERELLD